MGWLVLLHYNLTAHAGAERRRQRSLTLLLFVAQLPVLQAASYSHLFALNFGMSTYRQKFLTHSFQAEPCTAAAAVPAQAAPPAAAAAPAGVGAAAAPLSRRRRRRRPMNLQDVSSEEDDERRTIKRLKSVLKRVQSKQDLKNILLKLKKSLVRRSNRKSKRARAGST